MKYFMSIILLLALALPASAQAVDKFIQPRVCYWTGKFWDEYEPRFFLVERHWESITVMPGLVVWNRYYELREVTFEEWEQTDVYPEDEDQ